MTAFLEQFSSLAAWDFGSSATTELTLTQTGPSPYLGSARGAQETDINWAAAQYDLTDGGVAATMYWISYAFYVPDWADVNAASTDTLLPGFINQNVDPLDAINFVGTAGMFNPYLHTTVNNNGFITSYYGSVDTAVTEGEWHTVRYGLRLQGATSHETMYVDGVLVEDSDYVLAGADESNGLFGIGIGGYANSGPTHSIAIDSLMYSSFGDPGEPSETVDLGFQEGFNTDLSAWDFGTSPTTEFTIGMTSPAPYLGAGRATLESLVSDWGAARFDNIDGGDSNKTYWISYAFYLDTWANAFADFGPSLVGFIENVSDPLDSLLFVGGESFNAPYLDATSASTGVISSPFGDGTLDRTITAGEWHTVRYGLKFDGANSHETMYLDDSLEWDRDLVGAYPTSGVAGVMVGQYAGTGSDELAIDSLVYSAFGDPGEPSEASAPVLTTCGSGMAVRVFMDGTEVTNRCVAGGWTPRLNRPAQATVTMPMELADSSFDCGSKLKIVLTDGVGERIVFHGQVLNTETDTDKDGGRTVFNSQDPMEQWQFRPARDDGGDFSKPDFIQAYDTGPQILEALLINTVDSTGRTNLDGDNGGPPPADAEGTIPLDMGTFEAGGKSLAGAPVDWPMTIMEMFNLMVSTGQLDAVITYTDPGGGVMGTIDAYNGDYGTDRSTGPNAVVFQYGTGVRNVQAVRWNRDMTNMVNKYWLYGGPRVASAADPAGEQHWCFSVTGGTPSLLDHPPGGPLSPPASATNNPLGVRRFASIDQFGVRMQVDIQDGYDEDCIPGFGTPGRALYERQWQVFSWFSAFPRELLHIQPNPDVQIGCFDIGDIVAIEIAPEVRGGISGAQRVYEYTVSWEGTPSVLSLSEIQTSADAEGSGG